MSTAGYNGRAFKIKKGAAVIAAVVTKSTSLAREAIDVTNDDSDGWRKLLPTPGNRAIDVSIEGVATVDNYKSIIQDWEGNALLSITIEHPNGSTQSATDGFFLSSLEFSGEQNGHVTFSAQLQSSGVVTSTHPL